MARSMVLPLFAAFWTGLTCILGTVISDRFCFTFAGTCFHNATSNVLSFKEERTFLTCLIPVRKKETLALGDSDMHNVQSGTILLLEGKGYFRCDVPFVRPSEPMVLIKIPDGLDHSCQKVKRGLETIPERSTTHEALLDYRNKKPIEEPEV